MSPKNEVGCFITCGIIKCTEHNIGLKLRVQRMRFFNKIDETLAKVYGEKAKITNTENYYVYETTDLKISLETDGVKSITLCKMVSTMFLRSTNNL